MEEGRERMAGGKGAKLSMLEVEQGDGKGPGIMPWVSRAGGGQRAVTPFGSQGAVVSAQRAGADYSMMAFRCGPCFWRARSAKAG